MSYQDGNALHKLFSGYIVNPPKDYKPEKQKKLTDMFSNAALRENTFLKYLLLYMIINTSVMIVPIMRVRTVFILRIHFQMLITTFIPQVWSPTSVSNSIASIPILVTQLTNVTTQYGMTSTENAYMWMCGFAGEAIARPIFGYLSRHFSVITLVRDQTLQQCKIVQITLMIPN